MILRRTHARPTADRRGSTLIVVIALLASLMLLGFLFLTISSQEQENAYLFSEASKIPQMAGSDYFDFVLEQLVLGARDDYYNSALWGGRSSLLPTMFGNDLQPFNGEGVNLSWVPGAPGTAVVDQDFNGGPDNPRSNQLLLDADTNAVPDPNDAWLSTNLSPGAWFANGSNIPLWDIATEVAAARPTTYAALGMANLPAADVEYTAPDLSSPFLCYMSYEPTTGKRVIIPSFHRPQYLRDLANTLSIPTSDWYTNADLARLSMRPHRAHMAVTDVGNNSTQTRFVSDATDGDAADVGVFPFDNSFSGTAFSDPRDEGVWWGNTTVPTPPTPDPTAFDMDPDRDDIKEAVLVDLDYPVQQSADGTKTFVPLFAITVYDADGLFNLNAHGNAYGNLAMYDATAGGPVPFGDGGVNFGGDGTVAVGVSGATVQNDYISRSHQAVGPHEVNPQIGLDADIATASGTMLDVHFNTFQHAVTNNIEMANMEWWFVLAGRADIDTAAADPIQALFPGRWGEDARLRFALTRLLTGIASEKQDAPKYFPYPGASGVDDDGDNLAGAGSNATSIFDPTSFVFPNTVMVPPQWQPLDVKGLGRYVTRTVGGRQGKDREFDTTLLAAYAPFRLPTYLDYAVPGSVTPPAGVVYRNVRDANLVLPAVWRVLYSNAGDGRGDHPNETVLNSTTANSGQDSTFSPGESATLQFSNNTVDQNAIAFSQRLLTLVPFNFKDEADAVARRKMYATHSADLKTAGVPYRSPGVLGDRARSWETDAEPANTSNLVAFPPLWPQSPPTALGPGVVDTTKETQPFRPEAQMLLRNIIGDKNTNPMAQSAQSLVRKLSVNQVAEQITNPNDPAYMPGVGANQQRVRLRPLTPHPHKGAGLTSAPIGRPAGLPAYNAAGPTSAVPGFGVSDVQIAQASAATWAIGGSVALQEWHARRDRQNLARDIYVLLYTLGKANSTTTTNPVTSTNTITWADGSGTVYSLREMREMAQFAVNLVDAMDEDDNITCFVYDLNLADGYTNLDDGYSSPISPFYDATNHADADGTTDADGDGIPDNDFYHRDSASGDAYRGIVYGVETQQLAFGEALAIFAKKFDKDGDGTGSEYQATDWDDTNHYDFAYVELQNMLPRDVQLDGGWSIVCQVDVGGLPTPPRSVTLDTQDDQTLKVDPMQAFTVGTTGDAHNTARSLVTDARTAWNSTTPTQARPSHFSIDVTGDETTPPADWTAYETLAPVRLPLDFDMMEREHPTDANVRNSFRVNNVQTTDLRIDDVAFGGVDIDENVSAAPSSPKAGGWLNLGAQSARDTLAGGTVRFHLRRRVNLDRQSPGSGYPLVTYTDTAAAPQTAADRDVEKDNPWVIVDSIEVQLDLFDLSAATAVQTETDKVKSEERTEPLQSSSLAEVAADYAGTAGVVEYNNLGAPSVGPKQIWQPHYNRPFASLGEVLTVPLYGPREVTSVPSVGPPLKLGGLATAAGLTLNRSRVAAARVLFPDGATAVPASSFYNNLWYRAFEYLNVPEADGGRQNYTNDPWFTIDGGFPFVTDQLRQRDGDIAGPYQRFGKLNLNTIRHPHVFAGMLDDFGVMDRPVGQTPGATWLMGSQNGEMWDDTTTARQWWRDFLASRDGIDPATNLVLPGLAVGRPGPSGGILGRPFRGSSMALRAPGGTFNITDSLQDTIFRRMPETNLANQDNVRGLFELGTANEADTPLFDYTTRYRLLSKVLNHSTTRSNTFLVFIEAKFFKAKVKDDPATGQKWVRIGEWDGTVETPRGFFVVDRTKALELIAAKDLPQNNQYVRAGATTPMVTSSFARNPDGTPTFDWRKLVLSSTRIE